MLLKFTFSVSSVLLFTNITSNITSFSVHSYNKTEDLTPGGKDMMTFTHLMIGVLSDNHSELSPYSTTHKVLTTTFSYSGMGFSWTTFPFIHVRTKETLWILKRITDES